MQEVEIAARLQASILPPPLPTPGLDIAARMLTASEVGGDYYDVQPVEGACWIGIGDVAGHGLGAGVIMLMIQSMAAALVQAAPRAQPGALLASLNRVLYDNVRNRLGRSEHATLTLLRVDDDGAVTCAGAHQDIIVRRAATGRCECVATPGTWVGLVGGVEGHMPEARFALAPGDAMVLYTDGVTEAASEGGELFGLGRLCAAIEAHTAARGAAALRDRILGALAGFSPWPEDDPTVLVPCRHG